MKKTQIILYAVIFLAGSFFTISCSQNQKEQQGAETEGHIHREGEEGAEHQHETASKEGAHDNGKMESDAAGAKVWTPDGNGTEVINSDFHFITGTSEDINPDVIQGKDGKNILTLSGNGTPTAFVFHNNYSNVGLAASIKRGDFDGDLKLIHHAKDANNYEFVSINANTMKLGRVVDGKETVFDESEFSADNKDWALLKASAAGTHYKGYIGDKTITHGHSDQMEDGYVGLMIDGTGEIQVESIEVFLLDAE